MSDSERQAKEIFWSAVDHEGDVEAFIEQACGDKLEIRGRVEELLKAHRAAGDFLLDPNIDATIDSGGAPKVAATEPGRAEPKSSSQIGPYKLLQEIGEGGMGTVWLAQQSKPITRKVAIKLIKAGMDSQQVLARFEAERQALAMMDHPNIARVVDAGMTEQGRPYFAMEYVKGVPLTAYCDDARLSIKQRLELFLPICNAVQHAHQKGIVHRDLKPSNILICLYDGKPVPKVIDFGLAKAMNQSLTDQTLFTAHGMMIGTPLYMSPEQAEHNNLDIDTRTDVYSLGVILYELLAGTTPLEKAQLKQAAANEMLRLIKEVEPPKPSSRLSGSASLPNIAAQRNIEPAQLARSIEGDLDWVVMKALEKERSRRYETANGFAMDIQRHLCDEPVSASPPSTRYRIQKFIKRNRAGVMAAGIISTVLLLGVAGTTSGMFWAMSQQKIANRAVKAETVARNKADANAQKAKRAELLAEERLAQVQTEKTKVEQEKQIAEAVQNFLQDRLLGQADMDRQADSLVAAGGVAGDINRDVTIRELLDRTAEELSEKKIESTFPGQPRLRTEILLTVANSYVGTGDYDRAIEMMQRALDFYQTEPNPDPEKIGRVMSMMARAHVYSEYPDQAIPLILEAVKISEQVHGANHRNTINFKNGLGVAYRQSRQKHKALLLFKEVVELSKSTFEPEDPLQQVFKANLGIAYQDNEQPDEAIRLLEEVWAFQKTKHGAEHPQTIVTMFFLGDCYAGIKRFDKALPMLKETLKWSEDNLGHEHPSTIRKKMHLAKTYNNMSTPLVRAEALPLLEEALRLSQSASDSLNTTIILRNLADSFVSLKNPQRAVTIAEEAFDLAKDEFGENHPQTFRAMTCLAESYLANQQPDLAQPLLEAQYEFFNSRSGRDFPALTDDYHADGTEDQQLKIWIRTMTDLGMAYGKIRQLDRVITLFERVHEFHESQLTSEPAIGRDAPDAGQHHVGKSPRSREAIDAMSMLGSAYCLSQQYELGIPLIEEVYRLSESEADWDHPQPNSYVDFMASVYEKSGGVLEFSMLKESVQLREDRFGPNHPDTLYSMKRLGISYWSTEQYEEAIQIFEELVSRNAAVDGRFHATTLNLMVDLAANYLRAERAEDAISILEECDQTETPFARRSEMRNLLATAHQMAGNHERAIAVFNELLSKARKELPPESPKLASILAFHCMTLLKMERFAESEPLLRECLAIREKAEPDSWTTFNTFSQLGGALLGQQKYADAEPLLIKGYEGMDERKTSITAKPRLTEAVERLVELYKATDKPKEAAKWQAVLDNRQGKENGSGKTAPKESPKDATENPK